MKNIKEPNGNWARDVSACRTVPQITALPLTPFTNRQSSIFYYPNNLGSSVMCSSYCILKCSYAASLLCSCALCFPTLAIHSILSKQNIKFHTQQANLIIHFLLFESTRDYQVFRIGFEQQ